MDFYGLLGENLTHSLSPQIQNYMFKKNNRDCFYKLFEVKKEDFDKTADALRILDVRGVNVTIPYKQLIIPFCDELDPIAKETGSVNTILNINGNLKGYNTDYYGFGKMYEGLVGRDCLQVPSVCVVLGNGGAAKAVIKYLSDIGVSMIYIVSRRLADNPYNNTKIIPYDFLPEIKGDIIINTTPLGMYPHISACPVDKSIFKNFAFAMDLVYNPQETEFIRQARESGLICLSGLSMLCAQALKSQEIWQDKIFHEDFYKEVYEYVEKLLETVR